jgi:hypothetical protein
MTAKDNEHTALPDDLPAIEACMTCLSDDAALLHGKNPEDEVADNMLKAEQLMREMADLLAAVLGTFTRDDDLPDNLLQRIQAVLHRT